MERLRSVNEAAEVLGISVYTVRKYIKLGKLTPVRIGRRVLLEEAELQRFILAGKVRASETPTPDLLLAGA
jgi:excisionase family DNA binding protein